MILLLCPIFIILLQMYNVIIALPSFGLQDTSSYMEWSFWNCKENLWTVQQICNGRDFDTS